MSGEIWYAEFAYHAEDAWTSLLGREVLDIAEAVSALSCDFRVTREWQRGPHIRFGIRGGESERARALVDDGLAEIIRRCPSTRAIELAEVRGKAERLARMAGVALRTDWLADNSIGWIGPLSMKRARSLPDVLEDFHFAASLPALRMLDGGDDQLQVLRLCELMAATAERYGQNGLLAASMSFRSHAEAYLALEAPPGTRLAWDSEVTRSASALKEHLFAVARGEVTPAYVREWLSALDLVIGRARDLYRSGELSLGAAESGFDDSLLERSSFHRELAHSEGWTALVSSEWFVLYRLALNLLYLQFSRLGVRPAARYRLCHLVATAVQGTTLAPNKENS